MTESADQPPPQPEAASAPPSESASGGLPIWMWVAPMTAFLLGSFAESHESLRPIYPWVYAAKVAVVTVLMGLAWPTVRAACGPFQLSPVGVALGALGVAAWVALTDVQSRFGLVLPLIGDAGGRAAFDPTAQIADPSGRAAFLAVRFAGLALLVPIMEELFWRGFVARFVSAAEFERLPVAPMSGLGFAAVMAGFVLAHPEWLAAAVYAGTANLLLNATGRLWACIQMHAVTNLLLGVYVLATGRWEFW